MRKYGHIDMISVRLTVVVALFFIVRCSADHSGEYRRFRIFSAPRDSAEDAFDIGLKTNYNARSQI